MFNVLGINERNVAYVKPLNPKKAMKFAKNKLKSKLFLEARGIPVSKLIAVIKDHSELKHFKWPVLKNLKNGFVIKPNKGHWGEGILVIKESTKNKFYGVNGEEITQKEIDKHLTEVLDGSYSVLWIGDQVLIEDRIVNHSFFDGFIGNNSWLPDIRIIVYRWIPVMAMLRLPSKNSHGTANLHQGGIGGGIDIVTGKIINLIQFDQIVPVKKWDKLVPLDEPVPYFNDILYYSSKIQLATNIGYLAVDFALDYKRWPLVLEVNSRGWLAIQMANLQSLKPRLSKCEDLKVLDPKEGVKIAKSLFINKSKVLKTKNAHSEKKVIGNIVKLTFFLKDQNTHDINAKIKTTKPKSIIDKNLAIKMWLIPADYSKEFFSIKIKLEWQSQKAIFYLWDLIKKDYKVILGQNELKGFLVDPFLTKEEEFKDIFSLQIGVSKINYLKIDDQLQRLDQKVKTISILTPLNILEEKDKFFNSNDYNPQFIYSSINWDMEEIKQTLNKIKLDESTLGTLFLNKKNEIFKKIKLLESIGKNDEFMTSSIGLYGKPSKKLIETAYNIIKKNLNEKDNSDSLTCWEIKKYIQNYLKEVGLNDIKIREKSDMISSLSISGTFININSQSLLKKEQVKALIAHEVGTHIFTYKNSLLQPYKIFSKGFAWYLTTQEWLAIYNSELIAPDFRRLFLLANNVLLVDKLEKLSFREIYNNVLSFGYSPNTAWKMALKMKRGLTDTSQGGGFTKGYVYFKGYFLVKNFLEKGGDYQDLYYGKINLKDLSKIKEIKGLKKAKYVFDVGILNKIMKK